MDDLVSIGIKYLPHLEDQFSLFSDYMKRVVLREYLRSHRRNSPDSLLDTEFGGWVPDSGEELNEGEQIAKELRMRQILRREKKYSDADLIKRVVCSGSVEVHDFPNGTLYFLYLVRLPS